MIIGKYDIRMESDIKFTKTLNGFLSSNYSANVDVSVDGVVKKISVRMVTPYRKKEKPYFSSNLYLKFNLNDSYINHIKKIYLEQLVKEKEKDIQLRLKYYNNVYDKLWIHNIPKVERPGLKIKVISKEDYLKHVEEHLTPPKQKITLFYKDIEQDIFSKMYSSWDITEPNLKYILKGKITHENKRIYSKFENLIDKFILLSDFYIQSKKTEKIATTNRKKQLKEKYNYLIKIFKEDGVDIKQGYIGQDIERQLLSDNFSILINGERNIIIPNDSNNTFTYGGFSNLTKKQVKTIIKTIQKK